MDFLSSVFGQTRVPAPILETRIPGIESRVLPNAANSVLNVRPLNGRVTHQPELAEYLADFSYTEQALYASDLRAILNAIHIANNPTLAAMKLSDILSHRTYLRDFSILIPIFCSALTSKNQENFISFVQDCFALIPTVSGQCEVIDGCILKLMETTRAEKLKRVEKGLIFLMNKKGSVCDSNPQSISVEIAALGYKHGFNVLGVMSNVERDKLQAHDRKMTLFHFAVLHEFEHLTAYIIQNHFPSELLRGWHPQLYMITVPKLQRLVLLYISIYGVVDVCNTEGNTLLHLAMRQGLTGLAIDLIQLHDANVNLVNGNKDTVLHVDQTFNIQLLEFICSRMTNVMAANIYGNTCLHRDIPNQEYLATLIAYFSDHLDKRNNTGITPIFYQRSLSSVEIFMIAGADIKAEDDNGKNLIHYPRQIEALDFLIGNEVDVTKPDKNGRTAIGSLYLLNDRDSMGAITRLREVDAPIDDGTLHDVLRDYIHGVNKSMDFFTIFMEESFERSIYIDTPDGGRDKCTIPVAIWKYSPRDLTRFLDQFHPVVRTSMINFVIEGSKSHYHQLFMSKLDEALRVNPKSLYMRLFMLYATDVFNEELDVIDLKFLNYLISAEKSGKVLPKESLIVLAIDGDISEKVIMELIKVVPITIELVTWLFVMVHNEKNSHTPSQERISQICKIISTILESNIPFYRANRQAFLDLVGEELRLFKIIIAAEENTRRNKSIVYVDKEAEILWQSCIKKSVGKTIMMLKSNLPYLVGGCFYLLDAFDYSVELKSDELCQAVIHAKPTPTLDVLKKRVPSLIEKGMWDEIVFFFQNGLKIDNAQFEKYVAEKKFDVATKLLRIGFDYPIHLPESRKIYDQAINAAEINEESRKDFLIAFFKDFPFMREIILNTTLLRLKFEILMFLSNFNGHRTVPSELIVPPGKNVTLIDLIILMGVGFTSPCFKKIVHNLTDYEIGATIERLLSRGVENTQELIARFCKLRPEHMKEGMVRLNEPDIVIGFEEIKNQFAMLNAVNLTTLISACNQAEENQLPEFDPKSVSRYVINGELTAEGMRVCAMNTASTLLRSIVFMIQKHPNSLKGMEWFLDLIKPTKHYKIELYQIQVKLAGEVGVQISSKNMSFADMTNRLGEWYDACRSNFFDLVDRVELKTLRPYEERHRENYHINDLLNPRWKEFFDTMNFQTVIQDILILLEKAPDRQLIPYYCAELMKPSNHTKVDLHRIKMDIMRALYDHYFEEMVDPAKPYAIKDNDIKDDTWEGEISLTVANLRSSYKNVLDFIRDRIPYTATPQVNTKELELYYRVLERNYLDIMKKVLKEPTVNNVNYCMVKIATAGRHCAMRWLGDSTLSLRFLSKAIIGFKEDLLSDMREKRVKLLRKYNLGEDVQGDVHYYAKLATLMGGELGFDDWESYAGLNDPSRSYITAENLRGYFYPLYGMKEQLDMVLAHIKEKFKKSASREYMVHALQTELYPPELKETDEGRLSTFYSALVIDEKTNEFTKGFIVYTALRAGVLARQT